MADPNDIVEFWINIEHDDEYSTHSFELVEFDRTDPEQFFLEVLERNDWDSRAVTNVFFEARIKNPRTEWLTPELETYISTHALELCRHQDRQRDAQKKLRWAESEKNSAFKELNGIEEHQRRMKARFETATLQVETLTAEIAKEAPKWEPPV